MNLEGEGTIQYITDVELPHYKGERYKENKKTNPINLEVESVMLREIADKWLSKLMIIVSMNG